MADLKPRDRLFLTIVVTLAVFFAVLAGRRAWKPLVPAATAGSETRAGAAGRTRTVDPEQIRRLIREKRLSDHEATFYRTLPRPGTPQPIPPGSPDGSRDR